MIIREIDYKPNELLFESLAFDKRKMVNHERLRLPISKIPVKVDFKILTFIIDFKIVFLVTLFTQQA